MFEEFSEKWNLNMCANIKQVQKTKNVLYVTRAMRRNKLRLLRAY